MHGIYYLQLFAMTVAVPMSGVHIEDNTGLKLILWLAHSGGDYSAAIMLGKLVVAFIDG